jgi:hypothetical protein
LKKKGSKENFNLKIGKYRGFCKNKAKKTLILDWITPTTLRKQSKAKKT